MTEPSLPRFAQNEMVLLEGVPTRVTSWPADNEGPFAWEQWSDATQGWTRGTSYASQANIADYDGPQFAGSSTAVMSAATDEAVDHLADLNTEATLADPVVGQEPLPLEPVVVDAPVVDAPADDAVAAE